MQPKSYMLLKLLKWALVYISVTLLACGPGYNPVAQHYDSPKAHSSKDRDENAKPRSAEQLLRSENLQMQATKLEAELRQILQQQGSQAMARYLRLRAVQGLNLIPLREYFYRRNGTKPEYVEVSIPPDGEGMVVFANKQLSEAGVDFLQFKGVIDKHLIPLNYPLPEQKSLYRHWQLSRKISMPLIGFAVTIMEAGAQAAPAELIASIVRAFTVFALELQFRIFSNQWNRLSSKDKKVAKLKLKIEGSKLWHLKSLLNDFMKSAGTVVNTYLYTYLVNWGYAIILYAAQYLPLKIVMPGLQEFSVVRMIASSWVVNTGYFLAYGLNEKALGESVNRGEISETLRYQLETVAVAWAQFWRVVSFIPNMRMVGQVMLYSFGVLVTMPYLIKTYSARLYAQETARAFANNSGENLQPTLTGQAFGQAYDALPFSRQSTFGDLFASLREEVEQYLNQRFLLDRTGGQLR